MTKRQFRERIKKARRLLNESKKDGVSYGACEAISAYHSCNLRRFFSENFRPYSTDGRLIGGFDGRRSYWLGDFTKEGAERRLFYLDMFEQYCIVFKVYKEF